MEAFKNQGARNASIVRQMDKMIEAYITVARFAVDSVGTTRCCCHVIQRISNHRFLSQMASRGGQGESLVPPYTRGSDSLLLIGIL